MWLFISIVFMLGIFWIPLTGIMLSLKKVSWFIPLAVVLVGIFGVSVLTKVNAMNESSYPKVKTLLLISCVADFVFVIISFIIFVVEDRPFESGIFSFFFFLGFACDFFFWVTIVCASVLIVTQPTWKTAFEGDMLEINEETSYFEQRSTNVDMVGDVTLRPWKVNLFDCFSDCSTSAEACCCPCIIFGKLQHKRNNGSMTYHEYENDWCCLYCAFALCCTMQWALGFLNRIDFRMRHKQEGSILNDCCSHAFCHCCALVQEIREVQMIEIESNSNQLT
jgi:Cys-rich protein (TIGR01571 family)